MMSTRKSRHRRVRKKIKGTPERPRLCVFRSNKHTYAQIIDDEKGIVLVSAKEEDLPKSKLKGEKKDRAREVGNLIAKKAKKKKINTVVFDRAGYKYHGRVKALAEGARKAGLKF